MTDTTMGGGRGGVGIRLFTTGGEVVKRTFDQVGDSGRKMWAQIAMGDKAANPALRAVSRLSGEAQAGVQGLATKAGSAGVALGAFGAAGVGVAAVLGVIVLALNQTREALKFADDLEDSAGKINIGVEALQTYRYALAQVGGEAMDADSAIEGFQKKLGEGIAGGKSGKWFERIGFGQDDLKAFANTETALAAVIDKISALDRESERAAIAEKLGLGPMIPLLRDGADSLDDLRQEALALGIVMDSELVKRGAAANREMEILSQVIDNQLKEALIDLGPVLVDLLRLVSQLARAFNSMSDAFRNLDNKSARGLAAQSDNLQAKISRFHRVSPGQDSAVVRRWEQELAAVNAEIAERARSRIAEDQARTPGIIDTELADVSTAARAARGGGSSERDAERLARDRDRALEALARAEDDIAKERLQALYGPNGRQENQYDLDLAQVRLDQDEQEAQREALRAQLEKAGALDDIAKARLEELKIAQDENASARDAAILKAEERELIAKRVAAEKARDEDAIDLLGIDEQMATSAKERLEISRRILVLQQELERKLLEASADEDGSRSADEQAAIDRLGRRQGRELELFDHNAREDMRAQFRSYGHEVVEAIESGRLGENIADELKARLIDHALNGLFDFLYPKDGGGPAAEGGSSIWQMGANVISSMFGGPGPGRAGGGPMMRGKRHPIAETGRPELLMVGGDGQVTSAAETARLLRETVHGGANGGRMAKIVIEEHHHNNFKGAVMTEQLVAEFEARNAQTRSSAVQQAVEIAKRGAGPRQQSMRRLGT